MDDSRDFKDAESVRSGHSHVTSQPASFPLFRDPGGTPSRSLGMPSRNDRPPSIWDTHGILGNVFADPIASSTAPYPQELNPWGSETEEPLHSSTVEKNENQTPIPDQRCQSGPSAKNSVIPCEGDSLKNYGADQRRLQISDPHFDKFPTSATFAWWKIRFKTEVCACSQFPTEAMLWIKEVEMVESVDDLESLILKYLMRGLLQHWTESSIILTSKEESVWRNKKPKKRTVSFVEGRSLTWSTSASGSQEPTILSRIMPTCSLFVFEMMIFRKLDWKWNGIFLSMTKIPPDDILEGLYKLRIRESEQLKTVLELYEMEIHQKISMPIFQQLKTMVKRSIDQKLRLRNFNARHGKIETWAVVKSRKGLSGVVGRPRVVAGLGKSARMRTVRLMNSLLKGPKRIMTKVQ